MYTIKNLLKDVCCDLSRYEEECPVFCKQALLNKIAVALHSPAFFAILIHRFGYWINVRPKHQNYPLRYCLKGVYYVLRFISIISTKIVISQLSVIKGGLYISNKGNCIIGVRSMGRNCTIGYSTTIGMGRENMPPIIGNNVLIGSNTMVYGKITLGDNAIIEDNTVVSKNIPSGIRVRGNPARMVKE